MRAVEVAEYGGPETLTVTETATPDPGPGQVRIAVEAAGLNFADVEMRRGNYPDGPEPPFVPGMEAVGRIDAVGANVDRAVGERVACLGRGAFAERMVADAATTFDPPASLCPAEAAAVPVQWVTAHNCLHEWGGLSSGETVLVHAAAGGVGSAAVQLADAAGAVVVGTASTAAKRAFARERGADHVVDYEDADVVEAVAEITDRGVDLALDGVGGGAFRASVEALADCGRVVTYGMASGRPGTVATPRLLFANRSVVGYHLEHALEHARERVLTAHEPLRALLASGEASVHVDRRYALEEAAAAQRRLETRASRGKIVIEP